MKTIKLLVLLFVVLMPFSVFSQDTISTHITSKCLNGLRSAILPEYHFSHTADSIVIFGIMEANCGSSHIAIIRRSSDTIVVTLKDTGQMLRCYCDFNFRIAIKATPKDSLVVFKDSLYNLNLVADGLEFVRGKGELIDVIYDQAIESMRIRLEHGVQIKMVTIVDSSGRQMLSLSNDRSQIDVSDFESGIYILDFRLADNSQIIKKFVKK